MRSILIGSATLLALPLLLGATPHHDEGYGDDLCGFTYQLLERMEQTEPKPIMALLLRDREGPRTRGQITSSFDPNALSTCYEDWFTANPDARDRGALIAQFSVASDGTLLSLHISPDSSLQLNTVRDCAMDLLEDTSFPSIRGYEPTTFTLALDYSILLPLPEHRRPQNRRPQPEILR